MPNPALRQKLLQVLSGTASPNVVLEEVKSAPTIVVADLCRYACDHPGAVNFLMDHLGDILPHCAVTSVVRAAARGGWGPDVDGSISRLLSCVRSDQVWELLQAIWAEHGDSHAYAYALAHATPKVRAHIALAGVHGQDESDAATLIWIRETLKGNTFQLPRGFKLSEPLKAEVREQIEFLAEHCGNQETRELIFDALSQVAEHPAVRSWIAEHLPDDMKTVLT